MAVCAGVAVPYGAPIVLVVGHDIGPLLFQIGVVTLALGGLSLVLQPANWWRS